MPEGKGGHEKGLTAFVVTEQGVSAMAIWRKKEYE